MEDQTKSNYFIKFPPSSKLPTISHYLSNEAAVHLIEKEKNYEHKGPYCSSKHWINLTHGVPNSGIGDYAFEAIVAQLGFRPNAITKITFNTKGSLAPHQIISGTSTTNFSTTFKLCRKFKFGMQTLCLGLLGFN